MSSLIVSRAPRNRPQGGSFPWDFECTLDDVMEYCREIARQAGIPLDFTVECAWSETKEYDTTVPGTIEKLIEIDIERGGAMVWNYYPSTESEISYVNRFGEPSEIAKENRVKKIFRHIKNEEQKSTDDYMHQLKTDNPIVVAGA
jgi:hypothetical protein